MVLDAPTHDAIRRVLASGPGLALAVLFGSAAKAAMRPDSDIDVAVLPEDPELALSEELELQVALTRACGREVDLVRLDRASTLVAWQVASQGVPLWERSEGAFARFQARAASDYADFAPALERAGRTFRERLARGPERPSADQSR